MAQPIPLEIPPSNPRAEFQSRLEHAPAEHAEAVLAAYEVLQELHNRGVLEIMRGGLAASDELLERLVDNAKTPEAIRAIRNLFLFQRNSREHPAGMARRCRPGNSRRDSSGNSRARPTG